MLKTSLLPSLRFTLKVNPLSGGALRFIAVALTGVLLVSTQLVHAKPITVTMLAHNSEAKYGAATHLPYANPDAPKGGALSLSAQGAFNSANPWMTTGVAMRGTDYLYDTLMTGSLDESFVMYPQLANKVTYDPDDASWVIYHMNPDARFWDGTPVTSSDVKATFDALLNKGLMQMRSYLSDIERVEILDKQRVKFHFVSGDNKEILLTVGQFPIFAKASVDTQFDTLSLQPMMGSGPYKLATVDEGRSVTYQRDPNYWGQEVMANKGRFNFDTVKYVYYGSDEIALEGFKVGQYQFRQENTARNWATAYNFPAVKQGLIVKEEIDSTMPVAMQAFAMNLRRPLFDDIRVRQALTEAFDFELLNKTLFYNQYERLTSFFHGSELAATGTPSVQELEVLQPLLPNLDPITKRAVLTEWQLAKSDGQGYNRAALLRARKLLLAAGFYYKDMQLYQPDGKPAQIEILINEERLSRLLLPYIRNLKRLGFNASIRLVDHAQYVERLRNFDYDMIMSNFYQSLSPGAEQAYMWGSSAADEPGNRNYAGIKNTTIDAVIAKLMQSESREDIILYTKVLDRLLRAGYYMVPLYGKSSSNVVYWDKYRHVDNATTNTLDINYWWVDKQAEAKIDAYLH